MQLTQRLGAQIARMFKAPAVPTQSVRLGTLTSEVALENVLSAIGRLTDPDDILRKLGMGRQDLRRLEFDDEIGGALETRRDAAISSLWRLDETGEDGKPLKQTTDDTAFVRGQITAIFEGAMGGAWDARPYGYSVCEAVYRRVDEDGLPDGTGARLGFARVSVKPMQWFEPTRNGKLLLTRPGTGERVEVDQTVKFMLTRVRATYANPYGEALLSRLYWPWYFRHEGWRGWVQFMDRFGDPFVVGKSNDPTKLVESLLGMGVKNVIGVGTDDDLNVLMQSGGGEFDRMDTRLTERIQKMILGQTLTSSVGDKGSYALGKVHEQVRQDKRKADLRLLSGAGQWMVDALWLVNSFAGRPPRFIFADQAGIETERASRDALLIGANAIKLTKDYLLRAYDFEEGDIEIPEVADAVSHEIDPVTGKSVPKGKAKGKDDPKGKGKLSLAAPEFTPQQRSVEALVASAMANAPATSIEREALRRAILAATDANDLAERLAMLLDTNAAEFEQTLARAMFAAQILGYIHADEQ